jgi:hypothetical protein
MTSNEGEDEASMVPVVETGGNLRGTGLGLEFLTEDNVQAFVHLQSC